MGEFRDHVPEDLLAVPNVERLVSVLDEANAEKGLIVDEFNTVFNPIRLKNVDFLRKYLYQLGQLSFIDGMPVKILEQLILRAHEIFSLKGTRQGFISFIEALTCGDAEVKFDEIIGNEFLVPDDIRLGILPDGFDLLDAGTDEFIYLFQDDTTQYHTSAEVRLISPYFYIGEFRNFVAEVVPDMLPLHDKSTQDVTIRFYGHSMTSDEELNNFLYTV